jgi:hypothetical protein
MLRIRLRFFSAGSFHLVRKRAKPLIWRPKRTWRNW